VSGVAVKEVMVFILILVPLCPHVQDFSTSSLHGEVVREEAIGPVPVAVDEGEHLVQYQIVERRRWEQR